MQDEKPKKKRRYGPVPRQKEELRDVRLSVYFTAEEMERLKDAAGEMQPAAYLRSLAFDGGPVRVPELNKLAWMELSRAAANLNQLAKKLHGGEQIETKHVRHMLIMFREALLNGADRIDLGELLRGVPYEVENHKR